MRLVQRSISRLSTPLTPQSAMIQVNHTSLNGRHTVSFGFKACTELAISDLCFGSYSDIRA